MVKRPENEPIELETIDIEENEVFEVQPSDTPVKKSRKKLFILIGVGVVLLAIIATVVYLILSQKSATAPSTANTQPTPTEVKPDTLTAKILVEKSRKVVTGEVKETLPDTEGNPYQVYNTPAFRPDGYDFSVTTDTNYGFGAYGTKSTMSADLASIQKVLSDNKLTETVYEQGTDDGMYAAYYASSDIICMLTDQKPYGEPDTSTAFSTILGCADKTTYLENARTLKPYFVAFSAESTNETKELTLRGPDVKESKTPGYTTAVVGIGSSEYGSVGGFAGLFYTTPDKKLHYFTGTQSQLTCDAFNTDDLKKAYLGEECYDTNNAVATVTL